MRTSWRRAGSFPRTHGRRSDLSCGLVRYLTAQLRARAGARTDDAWISSLVKRTIRIGVCGWSYPDWRGVVYPQRRPKGFSELGHVASFVDAVELNVSFYRPPTPAMSEGWLRQVTARPDFRFTAKLWQRFTHDREGAWTEAEARSFKDGLRPLREAGRLEALLAQFPWSFRPTEGNLDRLRRVADSFGEWPCVVEVRNAEWQTDVARGVLPFSRPQRTRLV